jgi:hypothetical protein
MTPEPSFGTDGGGRSERNAFVSVARTPRAALLVARFLGDYQAVKRGAVAALACRTSPEDRVVRHGSSGAASS